MDRRSVGRSFRRLVGRLVGRSVGGLVSRSIGRSVDRLVGRSAIISIRWHSGRQGSDASMILLEYLCLNHLVLVLLKYRKKK